MKRKSMMHSPCWRRGATLIEAVAGLALLGLLLSAIVMARAKYSRQIAASERRFQAVAAADALLSQWFRSPKNFPRNSWGETGGPPIFHWKTSTIENGDVQDLGGEVVRVELFDPAFTAEPAIAIEVVVQPQASP